MLCKNILWHLYEDEATIGILEEHRFLSNIRDLASKEANCEGAVVYESKSRTDGSIDEGKYTVYLCCPSYKKKYTFPGGKFSYNTTKDQGIYKCSEKSSGCWHLATKSGNCINEGTKFLTGLDLVNKFPTS